jgi:hypothetical protein
LAVDSQALKFVTSAMRTTDLNRNFIKDTYYQKGQTLYIDISSSYRSMSIIINSVLASSIKVITELPLLCDYHESVFVCIMDKVTTAGHARITIADNSHVQITVSSNEDYLFTKSNDVFNITSIMSNWTECEMRVERLFDTRFDTHSVNHTTQLQSVNCGQKLFDTKLYRLHANVINSNLSNEVLLGPMIIPQLLQPPSLTMSKTPSEYLKSLAIGDSFHFGAKSFPDANIDQVAIYAKCPHEYEYVQLSTISLKTLTSIGAQVLIHMCPTNNASVQTTLACIMEYRRNAFILSSIATCENIVRALNPNFYVTPGLQVQLARTSTDWPSCSTSDDATCSSWNLHLSAENVDNVLIQSTPPQAHVNVSVTPANSKKDTWIVHGNCCMKDVKLVGISSTYKVVAELNISIDVSYFLDEQTSLFSNSNVVFVIFVLLLIVLLFMCSLIVYLYKCRNNGRYAHARSMYAQNVEEVSPFQHSDSSHILKNEATV